jgi:hypothetical protein
LTYPEPCAVQTSVLAASRERQQTQAPDQHKAQSTLHKPKPSETRVTPLPFLQKSLGRHNSHQETLTKEPVNPCSTRHRLHDLARATHAPAPRVTSPPSCIYPPNKQPTPLPSLNPSTRRTYTHEELPTNPPQHALAAPDTYTYCTPCRIERLACPRRNAPFPAATLPPRCFPRVTFDCRRTLTGPPYSHRWLQVHTGTTNLRRVQVHDDGNRRDPTRQGIQHMQAPNTTVTHGRKPMVGSP